MQDVTCRQWREVKEGVLQRSLRFERALLDRRALFFMEMPI